MVLSEVETIHQTMPTVARGAASYFQKKGIPTLIGLGLNQEVFTFHTHVCESL